MTALDVRTTYLEGSQNPMPAFDKGWRGFCATCGSSVCFDYKPRPERIYITVGILDNPNAYPAGFHDYRSSLIEWLHVDEQLPDAPGRAAPAVG